MSAFSPFPLPSEITTDDGLRLLVRRLRPEDKDLLQSGLRRLSPRSVYQRFSASVTSLSDQQLEYLTEIDGVHHVAFCAFDISPDDPVGTGVGRYVRLDEPPRTAESALTVVDSYQGQGIGSLLLVALLRHAAGQGIRTFKAHVLEDNRRFIEYLDALGALRQDRSGGTVTLMLPVYEKIADLPQNSKAQKVHRAWKWLDQAQPVS